MYVCNRTFMWPIFDVPARYNFVRNGVHIILLEGTLHVRIIIGAPTLFSKIGFCTVHVRVYIYIYNYIIIYMYISNKMHSAAAGFVDFTFIHYVFACAAV